MMPRELRDLGLRSFVAPRMATFADGLRRSGIEASTDRLRGAAEILQGKGDHA